MKISYKKGYSSHITPDTFVSALWSKGKLFYEYYELPVSMVWGTIKALTTTINSSLINLHIQFHVGLIMMRKLSQY